MIRLVSFDALHTLISPSIPVFLQYAHVFNPFLGHLDPLLLKASFKQALAQLQAEKPSYATGHESWWSAVIRQTAIGAGAHPAAVEEALPQIVPRLLKHFSSKEAYRLFDDALPTLQTLNQMHIKTALVSNCDSRILHVLSDLGLATHLHPILISEVERIEKPDSEIFRRACARAGVHSQQTLHVGDELERDYFGASKAGLHALLLRRRGPEGDGEHKDADEDLSGKGVQTIARLTEVVHWVEHVNHAS